MNLETAISYFKRHEGVVPHFYLDTRGLVTIGVGMMVPDPSAAQPLMMVKRGTGELAATYLKSLEWQAVHSQEKGHEASYYRQFTALDLPANEIDSGLTNKIAGFEAVLLKRFPKFEVFPDSVQLGCMDMVYSLGPGGLFNGFPHFCVSVDSGDWLSCAEECRRGGVSDQRNADCAALFRSAIREEIPT